MSNSLSRRDAVRTIVGLASGAWVADAWAQNSQNGLRVAPFSAEVTPPLGHPLLAGLCPPAKAVADRLYAHGLALFGAGKPIVITVVDWCEIRNDAYERWRAALAEAAGTTPERVLVSSVHQHDAPLADLEAQRILERHKLQASIIDLDFHERTVQRVAKSLRTATPKARGVTHFGVGKAKVEGVASNRRFLNPDGSPNYSRGSATTDRYARQQPEGTIDPWLRTLSFWDGEEPVAALSAYATHPMSYYRTGRVSADFPGLARRRRQAEMPKVAQIYASGAAGNVTAGKYNDGAPENRPVLAERLYKGMVDAWKATVRHPIERVDFRSVPLRLEVRNSPGFTKGDLEAKLAADAPAREQSLAALGLSWRKRVEAGRPIDLPVVDFGKAVVALLPAESYVEYQLLAQRQRPDASVLVSGYGECGPGYIPIERAWREHDSNLNTWCWVAPGAEDAMTAAIQSALTSKDALR